jgi:hypothetical protein
MVRNSADTDGTAIVISRQAWKKLIIWIQSGPADDLNL